MRHFAARPKTLYAEGSAHLPRSSTVKVITNSAMQLRSVPIAAPASHRAISSGSPKIPGSTKSFQQQICH